MSPSLRRVHCHEKTNIRGVLSHLGNKEPRQHLSCRRCIRHLAGGHPRMVTETGGRFISSFPKCSIHQTVSAPSLGLDRGFGVSNTDVRLVSRRQRERTWRAVYRQIINPKPTSLRHLGNDVTIPIPFYRGLASTPLGPRRRNAKSMESSDLKKLLSF